jgi:hypothetical protein
MAKQKGLIHFVGTLDGVNFYFRKGVPVARKAGGGFTRSSIKKSPEMVRVRENNSEFGTTSSAKKLFKDSLFAFLGKTKDGNLHGQMMQLFLKIKECDTISIRGQRTVSIGIQNSEGKKLLEQFNFTPLHLPVSNAEFDSLTSTFTFSDFDSKSLKFPKGATHLKLQLGIVSLDFEAKKAPLFVSTPFLIAKGSPVQNINLEVTAAPLNGVRVAVLYYRYTEELNGVFYDFKDKIAYGIKVLKVY